MSGFGSVVFVILTALFNGQPFPSESDTQETALKMQPATAEVQALSQEEQVTVMPIQSEVVMSLDGRE